MSKRFLAFPFAAVVTLAGCSSTAFGPVAKQIEQYTSEVTSSMNQHRGGQKLDVAAPVSIEKKTGIYLPVRKQSAEAASRMAVDPALKKEVAINRSFVSVQDFAERVTVLSGIPVVIAPDVAINPSGAQQNQTSFGQGAMNQQALNPGMVVPPLQVGGMVFPQGMANPVGAAGAQPSVSGFPFNLSYSGTLGGLLDVACARLGISYEKTAGQIRLYRYTSRTFTLWALPGDSSMDAKIGNSSGAQGSGGASQSASINSSSMQSGGITFSGLSVWKGIEESINKMLTPGANGGKVAVTPATGTVTVTDTPAVVATVEKFIEQQNASLGRQVVINVRALSVNLTESDAYGINWDAVYSSVSQNLGMAFQSGAGPITGAGSLTMKVLNTAGSTGSSIRSWVGSKAIIDALSKQGQVTSLSSASVTALNNQPSPINVGKETSYIASSSTTITSGIATTARTQGVVSTGFTMNLLPHILDDNRMLLQYAMDISSLLALNKDASVDGMETPTKGLQNFLQRIRVNSGDTIIVAGFENSELSTTSQGIGSASMPLFGGALSGKRDRNILVILMQPIIVD